MAENHFIKNKKLLHLFVVQARSVVFDYFHNTISLPDVKTQAKQIGPRTQLCANGTNPGNKI